MLFEAKIMLIILEFSVSRCIYKTFGNQAV